jgi:hypothetical protein
MVAAVGAAMIRAAAHFEHKPDVIPRESKLEKEFKASSLKRAAAGTAQTLLIETDSQSIA